MRTCIFFKSSSYHSLVYLVAISVKPAQNFLFIITPAEDLLLAADLWVFHIFINISCHL
jgi:hypothetical protein